jgi:pyruvate/2-oxoglutarate dehydrogenase complex dihydrolipoamide acyltransferase (E2) component
LVKGVYENAVDRVSAYEVLKQRAEFAAAEAEAAPAAKAQPKAAPASRAQSPAEAFASSAMRSLGTQIGRALVRGIMGSLSGGRRR